MELPSWTARHPRTPVRGVARRGAWARVGSAFARISAPALLLVAVACSGSGAPEEIEGIPGPRGEVREIAHDDGWRLLAQRSDAGPCLILRSDEHTSFGCGFEVPELHEIGYFAAELGDERFLVGPVTEEVETVVVERRGDAPVRARPIDTPGETDVYVAEMPKGQVSRVVALDARGEELEAIETPPDPWKP